MLMPQYNGLRSCSLTLTSPQDSLPIALVSLNDTIWPVSYLMRCRAFKCNQGLTPAKCLTSSFLACCSWNITQPTSSPPLRSARPGSWSRLVIKKHVCIRPRTKGNDGTIRTTCRAIHQQ